MEAPLILINRAEWLQRRLRLQLHASLLGQDKQSPFVKFVYFTLLCAARFALKSGVKNYLTDKITI